VIMVMKPDAPKGTRDAINNKLTNLISDACAQIADSQEGSFIEFVDWDTGSAQPRTTA